MPRGLAQRSNGFQGGLGNIQHEIKDPGLGAVGGVAHIDEQRPVEDAVVVVLAHAGKVELRGEDGAAGRLGLDMDMLGAAGIETGDDSLQLVAALGIAELVAAQPETAVIVVALGVGLPEVELGVGHGLTAAREYEAGKRQPRAGHARLDQRRPLR